MPDETMSPAALERLREWGGDHLVRQMIRLFLESWPERRRQVEACLHPGGDLDATERGAHSLKSGAANVGAMRVSALADRLERAAETGDAEGAAPVARELLAALDEAEPLLRTIMEDIEE